MSILLENIESSSSNSQAQQGTLCRSTMTSSESSIPALFDGNVGVQERFEPRPTSHEGGREVASRTEAGACLSGRL